MLLGVCVSGLFVVLFLFGVFLLAGVLLCPPCVDDLVDLGLIYSVLLVNVPYFWFLCFIMCLYYFVLMSSVQQRRIFFYLPLP